MCGAALPRGPDQQHNLNLSSCECNFTWQNQSILYQSSILKRHLLVPADHTCLPQN